MKTAFNFRDLGGIPVEGNRQVKKGLLFRSSRWDGAPDPEIEEFKTYGIKVTVDFRTKNDRKIDGLYEKMETRYVRAPFDIFKVYEAPFMTEAKVPRSYIRAAFGNKRYQTLLDLIKAGDVPLMFHCSAGKDRTGVAAALVLLLLGANEEAIVKDYMLTEQFTPLLVARWTERESFKRIGAMLAKRAMPTIVTREAYIRGAVQEIFKRYPSVEEFFVAEYGITQKDIIAMREKYTEPV